MLANKEGFRQKPFEWNYEGLKPLLLHEVLASRRGMTLSLCVLFSCVARRLGLALTPVPATVTGGLFLHLSILLPMMIMHRAPVGVHTYLFHGMSAQCFCTKAGLACTEVC